MVRSGFLFFFAACSSAPHGTPSFQLDSGGDASTDAEARPTDAWPLSDADRVDGGPRDHTFFYEGAISVNTAGSLRGEEMLPALSQVGVAGQGGCSLTVSPAGDVTLSGRGRTVSATLDGELADKLVPNALKNRSARLFVTATTGTTNIQFDFGGGGTGTAVGVSPEGLATCSYSLTANLPPLVQKVMGGSNPTTGEVSALTFAANMAGNYTGRGIVVDPATPEALTPVVPCSVNLTGSGALSITVPEETRTLQIKNVPLSVRDDALLFRHHWIGAFAPAYTGEFESGRAGANVQTVASLIVAATTVFDGVVSVRAYDVDRTPRRTLECVIRQKV